MVVTARVVLDGPGVSLDPLRGLALLVVQSRAPSELSAGLLRSRRALSAERAGLAAGTVSGYVEARALIPGGRRRAIAIWLGDRGRVTAPRNADSESQLERHPDPAAGSYVVYQGSPIRTDRPMGRPPS